MNATAKEKYNDIGLQQRVILHYSRMAEWLETRPWYRDIKLASIIRSLFPANPCRVLELCCGTGLLLETLSNVFPSTEFVGIDISPKMVERARERLSHRANVLVLNQDWVYELAPEWEHGFDVIVVKNALHLFDNVVTKLTDLRRVAQHCTTLIVVETVSPNVDANEFIKRLFQFADPEHLKQTFFTERTLTSSLQETCWVMAHRPAYVRQYIDAEDWLRQKCADRPALESARRLLSKTRNLRVRKALDFDTGPGAVPTRMLRLQYIARTLFTAAQLRRQSQKADSVQLQLV